MDFKKALEIYFDGYGSMTKKKHTLDKWLEARDVVHRNREAFAAEVNKIMKGYKDDT